MIKWFLRRGARNLGHAYNYDVTYMLDVIRVSSDAGLRLSAFPFISQYRGPEAAQLVWVGAVFASTLEGDCGPCVQLVVDMAIEAGADRTALKLCFDGDPHKAGDIGLGFRFAMAAIRGDLEADRFRQDIETRFGKKAVVAASFAAASGRFYPVFKRALGHAHACTQLQFGEPRRNRIAVS